jgi:hypothetical protein
LTLLRTQLDYIEIAHDDLLGRCKDDRSGGEARYRPGSGL